MDYGCRHKPQSPRGLGAWLHVLSPPSPAAALPCAWRRTHSACGRGACRQRRVRREAAINFCGATGCLPPPPLAAPSSATAAAHARARRRQPAGPARRCDRGNRGTAWRGGVGARWRGVGGGRRANRANIALRPKGCRGRAPGRRDLLPLCRGGSERCGCLFFFFACFFYIGIRGVGVATREQSIEALAHGCWLTRARPPQRRG